MINIENWVKAFFLYFIVIWGSFPIIDLNFIIINCCIRFPFLDLHHLNLGSFYLLSWLYPQDCRHWYCRYGISGYDSSKYFLNLVYFLDLIKQLLSFNFRSFWINLGLQIWVLRRNSLIFWIILLNVHSFVVFSWTHNDVFIDLKVIFFIHEWSLFFFLSLNLIWLFWNLTRLLSFYYTLESAFIWLILTFHQLFIAAISLFFTVTLVFIFMPVLCPIDL